MRGRPRSKSCTQSRECGGSLRWKAFRWRSVLRRAIPSTSANQPLQRLFPAACRYPGGRMWRHADGCDLPAGTDAALVHSPARTRFQYARCHSPAARRWHSAVETHVAIPDVGPSPSRFAVAKGSNEAVDGPAMLEPLRLALSMGDAMAGAAPNDRVFPARDASPTCGSRLCVEQTNPAIAG